MTEHEMDQQEAQQIREALKKAIPPVSTDLRRDLWPDVLRKLDTRPVAVPWYRVPWYDWALIGVSASVFLFFPHLILVFAYHL
jgi:hypothetical protein